MNKKTDQEFEARVEDYEEAVMGLLIYDVAKEDGKQLLAEAEELKRSGFKVPKELDKKCLKLIRGAARQKRNEARPRHFRLRKVGEILSAAILIAALLFCVAYATDQHFRVNVLNFFLELRENGTQFFFELGETDLLGDKMFQPPSTDVEFPFEFTYIPEGYEMFWQEKCDLGANGYGFNCGYLNSENEIQEFYFDIETINDGTGLLLDTENAEVTNATICGCDGLQIQKIDSPSGENKIIYFWVDLDKGYRYIYRSLGIPLEESQKIFDGIVIYEQYLSNP